MQESSPDPGAGNADARRNPTGRQLTLGRRLLYALATPLLIAIVRLLWRTCRVSVIDGAEHVESVINQERPVVPCYWHRDIFVCLMAIRQWIQRGFRAGIIISPSVDGDVPAKIAERWGAEVIRGSAQRTGALAMRDMHSVMRRGVSIVTAADGPAGPAYYFKAGILLTARIGKAPLLPIACAADRAWRFRTWDEFMLPKPFANVAIVIGDPQEVPARASAEELEGLRVEMQKTINALAEEASQALA